MVNNNKDFSFNDEVRVRIENSNHLTESKINNSMESAKASLDYIKKSFH